MGGLGEGEGDKEMVTPFKVPRTSPANTPDPECALQYSLSGRYQYQSHKSRLVRCCRSGRRWSCLYTTARLHSCSNSFR